MSVHHPWPATPMGLYPRPPVPRPGAPMALMLNLDGGLCAHDEEDDGQVITARTRRVLERLHGALGEALLVVSGRQHEEAMRCLDGLAVPVLGEHGRGRRLPSAAVATQVALAQAWWGMQDFPGVRFERKQAGLAWHVQHVPEQAWPLTEALRAQAASWPALRVRVGHGVIELLDGSVDKGQVLTAWLDSPALMGRCPVVVGADSSDETAFDAAVRRGGWGVAVGERPASAAQFWLPEAMAVTEWLAEWPPAMAGVQPLPA